MASDYKYCSAEVKTTDAQESLEGGIVVSITGFLTRKDDVKYHFSQTFFLAKQEKGFFVLNDILRFFDVWESITEAADDENHTQDSASSEACERPAPLNFKAAVQSGKVEEASDLSVSMKTSANEKSGEKETKEKVRSVVKPATDVKIPSVVTPIANVAPKITYASVLAKETTTVSPRVATVITKEVMSPKTRASSSPRSGDVSAKAPALSSKVSPKSPKGGQALPSTGVNSEAKGVYIGGLPYDITKERIVEVVKQFGAVRRYTDTVQIRRHEDGFCCGFVEFESAYSAWRAVQAHHVMFGEKEAYILYKRPPYNRDNNSRARSPTRRGADRERQLGSSQLETEAGESRPPQVICIASYAIEPHCLESYTFTVQYTIKTTIFEGKKKSHFFDISWHYFLAFVLPFLLIDTINILHCYLGSLLWNHNSRFYFVLIMC